MPRARNEVIQRAFYVMDGRGVPAKTGDLWRAPEEKPFLFCSQNSGQEPETHGRERFS